MNPRMKIHQFYYSASAADAVTNHTLLIQESLREIGISGDIFCQEAKGLAPERIRPFTPTSLWNCDLILIHHSGGNPALKELLKIEVPKALVYHNITPAKYFAHDAFLANTCHAGRKQLRLLRDAVVASFAVSGFNRSELEAEGFRGTELFPLLDLSDVSLPPLLPKKNEKILRLLFVGKLTPHKNQALLLKTLFYLKKISKKEVKLTLIGRADPVYGKYLPLLAQVLDLREEVDFSGAISAERLEECYQSASAFICPSLHEGFCVPLVEAMAHGLPIFALSVPGVCETLSGAGIELTTQKPHRLAEIILAALESPRVVETVLESQRERLQSLKERQIRQRIQTLCRDLLHSLRKAPFLLPNTRPLPPPSCDSPTR
jgi:glycosyltransferase involved in cell wall biosynthesis